ncbi:MAG: NAD-dependent dehydratase [Pseudomonadota bacterium]
MATVAVVGGGNQIAAALLPRLVDAGVDVRVLSRRPPPPWIPDAAAAGWSTTLDGDTAAVDALIWLAPLGLFPHLRVCLGRIGRIIAFSSTSASVKRQSSSAAERTLASTLEGGEATVRGGASIEGTPCAILRPTLIYGRGLDRNLTRIAHWAGRRRFFPLAHEGRGLRQPVHADDLAALAADLALRPTAVDGRWIVPGGERLSYREMVVRVYRSLGKVPRFVHVPITAVRTALAALQPFGMLPGLDAAMFDRMGDDLVFDGEPARDELGFAPRGFSPGFETWREP